MIIFDNSLELWFDKAVKAHCDNEKKYGILATVHYMIGSFIDGGDIHVAHIAKCPLPETATGEGADSVAKMIDDEWIVDNAEKVIRLLPGGIHLVGLVWFSNKKTFIDQKQMLTKALTRIARTTNSLTTLNLANISNEMALVPVDTPLGKIQSVVIDVVKRGPDGPSKVHFQALEWVSVVSRACGKIGQNLEEKNDDFYGDFVSLIKPWVKNLFHCEFALIDDTVRDSSEPLFKDLKKRKKNSVDVAIFLNADDNKENTVTPDTTSNWYDLVFDFEVRAAVPVKSKMEVVIAAVKQHIVRNLSARAVLHYESIEVVEDTSAPSSQAVHQMPRPATTTLPNHSAILFSDFLFEADSIEDAQKNINEILELKSCIEHVDDGWERALEVEEMEAVRTPGVVPDHAPLITSYVPVETSNSTIIIALSAIVAIVAIIMYQVMGK